MDDSHQRSGRTKRTCPRVRQSVAGRQTTLLGVVSLLLPVAVPDVSTDVFAGVGIPLALSGTGVVDFGLTR